MSPIKNCRPVNLFSVVSKVVAKLVDNNMIIDYLEKCDLFSDFQYGYRSDQVSDLWQQLGF